jgi:hypothetical protein
MKGLGFELRRDGSGSWTELVQTLLESKLQIPTGQPLP